MKSLTMSVHSNASNDEITVSTVPSNETRPMRKCFGIEYFEWLKLISNASIPLMIAIITVLITINQQTIAQTNRERDLAEAREQRRPDLDEARERRQEDMAYARQQREADQNKTRLQQEFERQVANQKRASEERIAEHQRNLTREQREHEMEIAAKNRANELSLEEERLLESILIEYQRDLMNILLNHRQNLSGDNDIVTFTIQMRTRSTLRLLDPQRRSTVISSLYDANLLSKIYSEEVTAPLAFANLSSADFGESEDSVRTEISRRYKDLNLHRAVVINSHFYNVELFNGKSELQDVNFDGSKWKYFKLKDLTITSSSMNDARFQDGSFEQIFLHNNHGDRIHMENLEIAYRSAISKSIMRNMTVRSTKFFGLELEDTIWTNGQFVDSSFEQGVLKNNRLDRIHFREVTMNRVKFFNVTMENCIVENFMAKYCLFQRVNMRGCQGLDEFHFEASSLFENVILPNGSFVHLMGNLSLR